MPIALSTWCRYIGKKWIILAVWLAVNGVLFYKDYCFYGSDPSYYYVHQILGGWLCVSRGAATLLNINCCLVLLPMCRVLTTLLRSANKHVSMGTLRLLMDAGKTAHIACAAMVCFATALHILGHLINVQNYSWRYNAALPAVNAADYLGQNPLFIMCYSVPGVTGLLMTVMLFLIATASTKSMRSGNFDMFWWIHRLVYPFLALMLVHAFRGPIRRQVNVEYHIPGCVYGNVSHSNHTLPMAEPRPEPEIASGHEYSAGSVSPCKEEPQFDFVGCKSWMWVAPGVLLYLLDGIYRWLRRTLPVTVVSLTRLPGGVYEVRLRILDFSAVPGQYVLIQCPSVSTWEWHPYSISRCPVGGQGDFSLHMRTHGDWSKKFSSFIQQELSCPSRLESCSPLVRVDGPFSGPLVSLLTSQTAVCVAGGIGVTPFASVLHCLMNNEKKLKKLKRLYFIWINRHRENVLWFLRLLHSTHVQLWERNKPDLLQVQFFFTGKAWSSGDCESGFQDIACTEASASLDWAGEERRREWAWLRSRSSKGRPDWTNLFTELAVAHPRCKVDVLVCGPQGLGSEVRGHCLHDYGHKTVFRCHMETF